jgi:hypothetical protein
MAPTAVRAASLRNAEQEDGTLHQAAAAQMAVAAVAPGGAVLPGVQMPVVAYELVATAADAARRACPEWSDGAARTAGEAVAPRHHRVEAARLDVRSQALPAWHPPPEVRAAAPCALA